MKYLGLFLLLVVSFLFCEEYKRFRQRRLGELDALYRYLCAMRDEITLYHTARVPKDLSPYEPLVRLGLGEAPNGVEALLTVVQRMAFLDEEKQKILDFCEGFGEGNVETEQHKLKKIIENVKMVLQKEEKEGKKSVDTVRIVAFTVALCLVIILL